MAAKIIKINYHNSQPNSKERKPAWFCLAWWTVMTIISLSQPLTVDPLLVICYFGNASILPFYYLCDQEHLHNGAVLLYSVALYLFLISRLWPMWGRNLTSFSCDSFQSYLLTVSCWCYLWDITRQCVETREKTNYFWGCSQKLNLKIIMFRNLSLWLISCYLICFLLLIPPWSNLLYLVLTVNRIRSRGAKYLPGQQQKREDTTLLDDLLIQQLVALESSYCCIIHQQGCW